MAPPRRARRQSSGSGSNRGRPDRRRIAIIIVAIALIVVLVLALVLAVIGTGSSSSGPQKTVGTFNPEIQFAIRCAPCHGAGGRGGPNLPGPKLAGGAVVKAFPNIEDQITFVSNGKGDMPAFKDRLTPDELRQIVEYTRTL